MQDDEGRLRHSMRGCLNSLKLSVAALDPDVPIEDALAFLEYIEESSSKLIGVMEQWDLLLEAKGITEAPA